MRIIPPLLMDDLQSRGFSLRCYRWKRWGFWPQATVEIYDPKGLLCFNGTGSQGDMYQTLSILRLGVEIGTTNQPLTVQATGHWNHNLKEPKGVRDDEA